MFAALAVAVVLAAAAIFLPIAAAATGNGLAIKWALIVLPLMVAGGALVLRGWMRYPLVVGGISAAGLFGPLFFGMWGVLVNVVVLGAAAITVLVALAAKG